MLLSLDFEGEITVYQEWFYSDVLCYFLMLTENLLIGRNANKLFNIVLHFLKSGN